MTEFHGRSLAFVRQIRGEKPRYGSAKEAADHTVLTPMMDEPPFGALIWWDNAPWGNVAIWLGAQLVLGPHPETGMPFIMPIQRYDDRPPAGWSMVIGMGIEGQ